MDWAKAWEETYRILRQIATAAAGFFASSAITTPFIDAKWDLLISIVCGAIGYGTSRQSDGLNVIPGVQIKKAGSIPILVLALMLGFGVLALTPIGLTGCGLASGQYRAKVTPSALAFQAPEVREDVDFGIQAAPPEEQESLRVEVVAFFEAVASKDATRVGSEAAPRWGIVKALALNGVDFQVEHGLLGTNGADIHRESIFRFQGLLNQVTY